MSSLEPGHVLSSTGPDGVTATVDFADLLDGYARQVEQLQGVSRTNPHLFAEAKSELVHAMRGQASRYRASPGRVSSASGTIEPGTRRIGGRAVHVEVRRQA